MLASGRLVVSTVALFALPAIGPAQYTFPAQKHGEVDARLTVEAAKQAPAPGLGEIRLTLTVQGPATLEVEAPRLSDATGAWKEDRSPPSRAVENQREKWQQTIRLTQTRPGVVPVADVSVRFRARPEAAWSEAQWIDILEQPRDGPYPPVPPASPSWLQRGGLATLLALASAAVIAAWRMRRQRRQAPRLTAEQQALRELERIEQDRLPPEGEAAVFHTQLAHVVRRYLAERFGLNALQQTTSELLEDVRRLEVLSEEQQTHLRTIFARCDLARFARVSMPADECRETLALARALVRQTTPRADKGAPA